MRGFVIWTFIALLAITCSGCASKPVIVDTGDIERLRAEYQQLRSEYDQLQSDYQQLVTDQQFYADYYQHAAAAIESGLGELQNLGTDSAGEIQRLRAYITILRNIVNNIIAGQQSKGQRDIKINAE